MPGRGWPRRKRQLGLIRSAAAATRHSPGSSTARAAAPAAGKQLGSADRCGSLGAPAVFYFSFFSNFLLMHASPGKQKDCLALAVRTELPGTELLNLAPPARPIIPALLAIWLACQAL